MPRRDDKEPTVCCREFMKLSAGQRDQWEWQVIHQLGHSRTTFSADRVMELARVDRGRAGELIAEAERLKWIWTPYEGLWVGRLTARR